MGPKPAEQRMAITGTGAITTAITTGQAGLGLVIVFCIAAIWAASGPKK